MGLSDDIASMAMVTTKKWHQQRKAEYKNRRQAWTRGYQYSDRVYHTDVAKGIIAEAYHIVSGGGSLPAHCRQLFYRCRPMFYEKTGRQVKYAYFSQTLVRKFAPADAWITYDERGTFYEPHTKRSIGLGTLDVGAYIRSISGHVVDYNDVPELPLYYPTKGAKHRLSAILFIEKQGFDPLFEKADLANRYDLGIMSSKGQSTTAARKLLDHVGADIPILVMHDFDTAGFMIANAATRVTEAAWRDDRVKYEFINDLNTIDIGLRLEDVEKWDLDSEPCTPPPEHGEIPGATQDEIDFLANGERVELNAFSSPDLIEHIEDKLAEHGINKVVPDDDTLQDAYRRAHRAHYMNRAIRGLFADIDDSADELDIPSALNDRVTDLLDETPTMSWDEAIAQIAADELSDE
jgi:hypothetical protein